MVLGDHGGLRTWVELTRFGISHPSVEQYVALAEVAQQPENYSNLSQFNPGSRSTTTTCTYALCVDCTYVLCVDSSLVR